MVPSGLGKTPESEMCRGSSRALCWFSAAAVREVTEGCAGMVGTLLVTHQHPQLTEGPRCMWIERAKANNWSDTFE